MQGIAYFKQVFASKLISKSFLTMAMYDERVAHIEPCEYGLKSCPLTRSLLLHITIQPSPQKWQIGLVFWKSWIYKYFMFRLCNPCES